MVLNIGYRNGKEVDKRFQMLEIRKDDFIGGLKRVMQEEGDE